MRRNKPTSTQVALVLSLLFSASTGCSDDGTPRQVVDDDQPTHQTNHDGGTGRSAGDASQQTDNTSKSKTESLEIAPRDAVVALQSTLQLSATAVFVDNTSEQVTAAAQWRSSDSSIATVSSGGLVTAVAGGTVEIFADYDGSRSTASITVSTQKPVALVISPDVASVGKKTRAAFAATGVFSDGATQDLTEQVTWSLSNEVVAQFSDDSGSKGMATGLTRGRVQITADYHGLRGTAQLIVRDADLVALRIEPASASLPKGTRQQLQAVGIFSDGSSQRVTDESVWRSSSDLVAHVAHEWGSKGLVSAAALGSVDITAELQGYRATATVTVVEAALISLQVTPESISIPLGNAYQMAVTGRFTDGSAKDLADQVVWRSSNDKIMNVSNAEQSLGQVTGMAEGTVNVSATHASGVTADSQVTITAPVLVSLVVTPQSASVVERSTLQLVATGRFSDGSTKDVTDQVTWHSGDEDVVTIANDSNQHGLAKGQLVGSATVDATDDETGVTTTAQIRVVPVQ